MSIEKSKDHHEITNSTKESQKRDFDAENIENSTQNTEKNKKNNET
jgi:hypothetical protein